MSEKQRDQLTLVSALLISVPVVSGIFFGWQAAAGWLVVFALAKAARGAWRWLTRGTVPRKKALALRASTEPWAALDDILPSYEDPDHPLGKELGVKPVAKKPKPRSTLADISNAKNAKELRDVMRKNAKELERKRVEAAYARRAEIRDELALARRRARAAEALEIPGDAGAQVIAEARKLEHEYEHADNTIRYARHYL